MYYPPPPPRPRLAHEQLIDKYKQLSPRKKLAVWCIGLILALSLCICSATGNRGTQTALATPTVIVVTRIVQPTQQPTIVPTIPPKPTPSPTEPPAPPETTGQRTGAVCNDGTTSTATGSGACSHHHGVSYWTY